MSGRMRMILLALVKGADERSLSSSRPNGLTAARFALICALNKEYGPRERRGGPVCFQRLGFFACFSWPHLSHSPLTFYSLQIYAYSLGLRIAFGKITRQFNFSGDYFVRQLTLRRTFYHGTGVQILNFCFKPKFIYTTEIIRKICSIIQSRYSLTISQLKNRQIYEYHLSSSI